MASQVLSVEVCSRSIPLRLSVTASRAPSSESTPIPSRPRKACKLYSPDPEANNTQLHAEWKSSNFFKGSSTSSEELLMNVFGGRLPKLRLTVLYLYSSLLSTLARRSSRRFGVPCWHGILHALSADVRARWWIGISACKQRLEQAIVERCT